MRMKNFVRKLKRRKLAKYLRPISGIIKSMFGLLRKPLC
jgi:hypothetical protein